MLAAPKEVGHNTLEGGHDVRLACLRRQVDLPARGTQAGEPVDTAILEEDLADMAADRGETGTTETREKILT